MSYARPFNGEYNHHSLFKVGSSLYLARWSSSEFHYWVRPVVICSININPEESITYNVRPAEAAGTVECPGCELWDNPEAAKEYAYRELLDELLARHGVLSAARDKRKEAFEEADRQCRDLEQQMANLKLVSEDAVDSDSH